MPDVKVVKLAGRREEVAVEALDVAVHSLRDVVHEMVDFRPVTFDDQFNPAIGQVADVAMDVVLLGDVLDSIAEADPLHSA